jgi:hypothetical protein
VPHRERRALFLASRGARRRARRPVEETGMAAVLLRGAMEPERRRDGPRDDDDARHVEHTGADIGLGLTVDAARAALAQGGGGGSGNTAEATMSAQPDAIILSRIRTALNATSGGGVDPVSRWDRDGDGRVSASELAMGLAVLNVRGVSPSDAVATVATAVAWHRAARGAGGRVASAAASLPDDVTIGELRIALGGGEDDWVGVEHEDALDDDDDDDDDDHGDEVTHGAGEDRPSGGRRRRRTTGSDSISRRGLFGMAVRFDPPSTTALLTGGVRRIWRLSEKSRCVGAWGVLIHCFSFFLKKKTNLC